MTKCPYRSLGHVDPLVGKPDWTGQLLGTVLEKFLKNIKKTIMRVTNYIFLWKEYKKCSIQVFSSFFSARLLKCTSFNVFSRAIPSHL